MNEQILYFDAGEPFLQNRLQQALQPLHIQLGRLSPSDMTKSLASLAGIPMFPVATPNNATQTSTAGETLFSNSSLATPTAPLLIFVGLSSDQLDQVLAQLRKNNIKIPHKAVLTPTNQAWTPIQIFNEIDKDWKAMTAAERK